MRIVLIADGRSPITKSWIRMLRGLDHDLFLISTFPYTPIAAVKEQIVIPIGFSSFAGGQVIGQNQRKQSVLRKIIANFRPLLMRLRALLTPLLLPIKKKLLNRYIEQFKPDIVHALRIPYEGMLASFISADIPLIVSIWGNDLTLHAKTMPIMEKFTQKTLKRVNGLMADTKRDVELAQRNGLRVDVPRIVVPGSGGLDLKMIKLGDPNAVRQKFKLPDDLPLIINTRGFRPGSVHQDVFFRSIPHILHEFPEVHFICPGMLGQPQAEKWVHQYGVAHCVTLLPFIQQEDLRKLYKLAEIYISLSSHDGTPNSFLEAIAAGCFPIVGDIASLREWVEQDKTGLLINPFDPQATADAAIFALRNEKLRQQAAKENSKKIIEHAEINKIRKIVGDFYLQVGKVSST